MSSSSTEITSEGSSVLDEEIEDLRLISERGIIIDPCKIGPYKKKLADLGYNNFWDCESENWSKRFDPSVKEDIKEIIKRYKNGICLNLGAGSEDYSQDFINIDNSFSMLRKNNGKNKILFDLNTYLPFREATFDTAYAIFVLNYIKDIDRLTTNIKSILKEGGTFIAMQCPLNNWYQSQSHHTIEQLHAILSKHFDVKSQKKGKVTIFICKKIKD